MATTSKPVFRVDVGGTLTFAVPEGTPSGSPTVKFFDETQTEYTTGSPFSVTTSGTNLSVTVPAGLVDTPADNYRAEWTYTVSSTSYKRDQLFEARARGFFKTLTATELAASWPLVAGRPATSTSTIHGGAIDFAFDRVHSYIRNKGANPNKIVDPQPFERALECWAVAHIARNLAPKDESWHATADQCDEMGRQFLEAELSNVDLYGEDEDGGAKGAVPDVKLNSTVFSR